MNVKVGDKVKVKIYNKLKKKFSNLVYTGEVEEIFEENLFILKMNGDFKLLVDGKFDLIEKL